MIDYTTYIRYPHKVSIGNSSVINRGCKLIPGLMAKNAEIEIGNNVALGPYVCLLAAGHDHTSLKLPDTGAKITIGDYCWIGGNSTILQGVTIGEGGIVGAGSVVTKDVPPYKIVAGIPARIIKDRVLDDNIK
ncbi:DapH/DapD/GlmU-related protein [Desulfovibrio sp. JC010]|uniref:acyltransferase n=1 Tax=Desulfovibrio sp. JC010 TaxID=2593641 RepID=UPI0013D2DA0B|nr:acyltransferase [Desulfovibrio sp. JC010]